MTVREVTERISARVFAGSGLLGGEVEGCYIGDLLSLAMSRVQHKNIWITIQTNMNIAAVAALADAGCIIIADGFEPDAETVKKAEIQDIVILGSELSAYELAIRLSECGI